MQGEVAQFGLQVKPSLSDGQWVTARWKAKVLRDWQQFISSGFSWPRFTAALYYHLTQHCSFAAHYDREGFYAHYFTNPERTLRFLEQFDEDLGCRSAEGGGTYWLKGECADLNMAMVRFFGECKLALYDRLRTRARNLAVATIRRLIERYGLQDMFQEKLPGKEG